MESNEENEYRNKLGICVQTIADKMAVLEARDRLMRLKRLKQTDLATAVAVVGTCPDMCPELERYFRQETNQVSLLEMDGSTGRPDEHRMIKEYRRSGADQEEPLAHELRPTPVLNRTMDYLCANIMDTLDVDSSCGEWYDFVWSRTRSIRKDITQQHLCDQQVVALTEKCSRFHIHCSAALCQQNVKDFDPKINEENLSNCLQSLKDLYYDLSLRDVFCPNEPEFRSYEILLHLNDTAILKDVQNYRPEIRDSSAVQMAIKAFFAYQSNNYIKFFAVVDQCSYLMACILHRYFTPVRQKAFKILRKCYTSNPSSTQEYPQNLLISCLGFEDSEELKTFCDHIGLQYDNTFVRLIRGQNQNNPLKAKRSLRLVEGKRVVSLGQIVNGCPLPSNPYKTTPIHNSFDSEGRLKSDAIEALDQKNKTITGRQAHTQSLTEAVNTQTDRYGFSSASAFSRSVVSDSTLLSMNSSNIVSINNSLYFQNENSFENQIKPKTSLIFEMPSNQLSDELVTICANIVEDVINELINDELLDICNLELKTILNQILEKTISEIFTHIFLNTCDQMIEEISVEVIESESRLRRDRIQQIDCLSVSIFNELLSSQIISISSEVFIKSKEKFIEKQNILIANQFLNLIIDELVKEIASEVLSNETQLRDKRVERLERLQIKYYFKWKNWFLRRKRFKYWLQSFPAAPNWGAVKATPNTCLYTYSDLNFNEQFSKTIGRELLANDLLNFFIDIVIKDMVCDVFQDLVSAKTQYFDYFLQKRLKRIERKYFSKWKQFCDEKRHNLKINSFPAHHWRGSPFKCKTKHKFSNLDESEDNETLRKRLRQLNDESSPESSQYRPQSLSNIKSLFETEFSESKQLTERLTKEINCNQSIGVIDKYNYKSIERDEHKQDVNEVECDVQVVTVFESETDKMNRLKRLLSEERDYFSLHNFVDYLKQNN